MTVLNGNFEMLSFSLIPIYILYIDNNNFKKGNRDQKDISYVLKDQKTT